MGHEIQLTDIVDVGIDIAEELKDSAKDFMQHLVTDMKKLKM